mgnify:FL=1
MPMLIFFNRPGLGTKIVLTCVWLVFNTGLARSEGVEFKPLSGVLAQEQSVNIVYYTLKRCLAAYTTLKGLFEDGQVLEEKEIQQLEAARIVLLSYILEEFAPENGISTTPEAVTKSTEAIVTLYMKNSNENYEATGNILSDFLKADIEICNDMLGGY